MELTAALFIGVVVVIGFALFGYFCLKLCNFKAKERQNIIVYPKRSSTLQRCTSANSNRYIYNTSRGSRENYLREQSIRTGLNSSPTFNYGFIINGYQLPSYHNSELSYTPKPPPLGYGYYPVLLFEKSSSKQSPSSYNTTVSSLLSNSNRPSHTLNVENESSIANNYLPESISMINETASKYSITQTESPPPIYSILNKKYVYTLKQLPPSYSEAVCHQQPSFVPNNT